MRIGVTHSESHPVDVDRFRERLAAGGGAYTVVEATVPPGGVDVPAAETLIGGLGGCDGLFVRAGRITADVLDALPSVRAIQTFGSGYEHVDLEAATARSVAVSHNPESPTAAVVERTVGLAVALTHGLPSQWERCAAGEWTAARRWFDELGSLDVGVVGLGTIGFPVARAMAGTFGSTVLGSDPYVAGERSAPQWPRFDRRTVEAEGIDLVPLDDLCDRADLVTVHVPLTDGTRGIIGRDRLARLAGCYLVNTSRGGVIDEPALVELVRRDHFAGVALDVLETEPPDSDHPLLGAPGVLVTPHTAGTSHQTLRRAVDLAAGKLPVLLAGDAVRTVLNPSVATG